MTHHWIALRLWGWAAALRLLKKAVPLETLVRLTHRKAAARPRDRALETHLEAYLRQRERFPWRPPSNCLERSLATYRILCRANAAPTLVVGLRRSPREIVEGHVWVVLDGRAFAEAMEEVAAHTPVVRFDAHGRRSDASASDLRLDEIRFP